MARFLKVDVATYLPDATPDEIAAAGGSGLVPEGSASDIAELEARTASDPKDYEAWMALATARAASGDSDSAAADIAEAKRQFAGAPFLLSKFNELERSLGLDLVALDAGPKGPTTEDMAAAAEMTQEDRDDMIAGMVAGLAARLDEQPNDPEGWAMLIRSYQTLGDAVRAEAALERATELFEGTEAYQVILGTR
jgi:cytochrome c-type biogenesis protein CcmH